MRLFRQDQFPDPRKLAAALPAAGLAVLADRRAPGAAGQIRVLAIGART
jgi:hypothetical protein